MCEGQLNENVSLVSLLGWGLAFFIPSRLCLGPPLAILFNNQGLVKTEFRAGLGLVRVAELSLTAVVYYHLGLYSMESLNLLSVIVPSVLVGIPVGAYANPAPVTPRRSGASA